MIDYKTYKRRFGEKDEKNNEYHVTITEDIYDMFSRDKKFGIAFHNEIALALIEDALKHIAEAMMNNDKEGGLESWKKVAELIRKVLLEYKDNENKLNDRFYEMAASPEEKTFFQENPIQENNISVNISRGIGTWGMFYRAMQTQVGEAVCQAIVNAKKKAVEDLYTARHKNGTSSYYNILNFLIILWGRRVSGYETHSKSLKLINRSIENARRK